MGTRSLEFVRRVLSRSDARQVHAIDCTKPHPTMRAQFDGLG